MHCGGTCPIKCPLNATCQNSGDCQSGTCEDDRCTAPVAAPLQRPIGPDDTTLPVGDLSQFPDRGEVQVDDERMRYDGIRRTTNMTYAAGTLVSLASSAEQPGDLLNLQRGVAGTVPAAHAEGALVALIVSACAGDCENDEAVTVDELIQGIAIAPGIACSSFDRDSNGSVTVDELVTALNNALSGCPP
jgi:hypothetical protein